MFKAGNMSPTPRSTELNRNGKPSVKHLECWWWRARGHCKYSEEECLYSHHITGHTAEAPRQLVPGEPARAGRSLENAIMDYRDRYGDDPFVTPNPNLTGTPRPALPAPTNPGSVVPGHAAPASTQGDRVVVPFSTAPGSCAPARVDPFEGDDAPAVPLPRPPFSHSSDNVIQTFPPFNSQLSGNFSGGNTLGSGIGSTTDRNSVNKTPNSGARVEIKSASVPNSRVTFTASLPATHSSPIRAPDSTKSYKSWDSDSDESFAMFPRYEATPPTAPNAGNHNSQAVVRNPTVTSMPFFRRDAFVAGGNQSSQAETRNAPAASMSVFGRDAKPSTAGGHQSSQAEIRNPPVTSMPFFGRDASLASGNQSSQAEIRNPPAASMSMSIFGRDANPSTAGGNQSSQAEIRNPPVTSVPFFGRDAHTSNAGGNQPSQPAPVTRGAPVPGVSAFPPDAHLAVENHNLTKERSNLLRTINLQVRDKGILSQNIETMRANNSKLVSVIEEKNNEIAALKYRNEQLEKALDRINEYRLAAEAGASQSQHNAFVASLSQQQAFEYSRRMQEMGQHVERLQISLHQNVEENQQLKSVLRGMGRRV